MATQKTHRQLLAVTSRTSWASLCGDISRSLLPPECDAVRHQPHLRISTQTPLGAGFPANLEPIQRRIAPHRPDFYHLGMWWWIFCTFFCYCGYNSLGHQHWYSSFIQCIQIYFSVGPTLCTMWRTWFFFYAFSNISPLGHLQFWYPSPTLFCRLCLHHWSPPLLSTFCETLLWAILVWESKILATQLFSIAYFICWNGSHFCLWGGSWR